MERIRKNKKWLMSDLSFIRRHLPYSEKHMIARAMGVSVKALDKVISIHGLKSEIEKI